MFSCDRREFDSFVVKAELFTLMIWLWVILRSSCTVVKWWFFEQVLLIFNLKVNYDAFIVCHNWNCKFGDIWRADSATISILFGHKKNSHP